MGIFIDNVALLGRYMWSMLYPSYSYVILFVTARCNARCKTCFYWQRIEDAKDHDELSADEYEKIAQSMRWILYLSISGGEPFLRTDLARIVRSFYRHSDIRFLNISTNCLLHDSITSQTEQLLVDNPKLRVKITLSIDDVGDRHDAIRGVPGNFEKCLRLHDSLVAFREKFPNLTLEVGSTFCSYNEDTAVGLIDFVADHLRADDHTFTYVRGDAKDPTALNVSLQKYAQTMTHLKERKRGSGAHGLSGIFGAAAKVMYDVVYETVRHDRMLVRCVAGTKLITVDERGVIRPCEILWQKCGSRFDIADLRKNQYNLTAARSSPASAKVRKFIRDTDCHCSFECANLCNIVYAPKLYPQVLKHILKR